MRINRLSAVIISAMLSACVTGCGDNDDNKSSSKSSVVEAQTIGTSTVDDAENVETTTIDEIQKALEEQKKAELQETDQNGLQKHTNRKEEGYYLEDYITVNFKGYEHDSEVEVIVDWDKLAADLGNDITPDILEQVYRISVLNTDDMALDHSKVNDLINGDEVNIRISERTLQANFKQKYTKELKYIDENVWYYEDTPAIVSGLKNKSFIENANEVDKNEINAVFDTKMTDIKDSTKNFTNAIKNDYGVSSIDSVFGRNSKITDKTMNCRINDYKVEKTYLATRTAASYNNSATNGLPENMVFTIYKLTVERYGSEEIFDLYYRAEISNALYENGKMIISDDTVKVQFAGTSEELIPDSQYWKIQEVK